MYFVLFEIHNTVMYFVVEILLKSFFCTTLLTTNEERWLRSGRTGGRLVPTEGTGEHKDGGSLTVYIQMVLNCA